MYKGNTHTKFVTISADDNQIFDLNFTIGEVGLSEIKLAHKNGRDDIVRYRIKNSGHENRLRPHTMLTVILCKIERIDYYSFFFIFVHKNLVGLKSTPSWLSRLPRRNAKCYSVPNTSHRPINRIINSLIISN